MSATQPEADTRRWLERAVIGLNLCPFAKAVHVKGQVHYAVCGATEFSDVMDSLDRELDDLLVAGATARDTTLLMLPNGFEYKKAEYASGDTSATGVVPVNVAPVNASV